MLKQTAPDCDGAQAAGRFGMVRAPRVRRILFAGCAALMCGPGPGEAAENLALGRYLSAECTTCHQLSGSSAGGIPAIVGWPEDQFIAVLAAYGRKERVGVVMQAIAAKLSPAEMTALAVYFGTLSRQP